MSEIEIKNPGKEITLEEVVPTLFIGLGGTGAEIMWRIRRRILNTLWGTGAEKNVRLESLTDFPIAEFLHIDLDSNTVSEQGKAMKTDLLAKKIMFKENERVVKSLDMTKYTRSDNDLARYPLIKEWFPLSRTKINELNIPVEKGAGQIRAFSRLYFFDKYQEIKNAIRSKAEHLRSNVTLAEHARKLGLEVKTGDLKIVAIASTAGGTGSGCFLDLGYLSKIIAEENTVSNLILLLPTGYQGANRTRTQANTYASLMELETSMRQGARFIHEWSDSDNIEKWPEDPYDDIYLIDTANLASSQTEDVKDIYNMVADAMFEDFSTKDFANKKRSVSVNQNQHKSHPYETRLDKSIYGDMKMTFSRAYSSFGQAIIDMHIEKKKNILLYRQVNDMLKVFFGVSMDEYSANSPTDIERDQLMSQRLYLGADNEIINYEFIVDHDSYRKGVEKTTWPLVNELLRVNGISRLDDIEKRISERFEEIRIGGNFREWPKKIAETIRNINHDTFSAIESGTGLNEDLIRKRRETVLNDLLDPTAEKGFIKALWMRVDNKERGGLDYTIKLIHSIKDKIESPDTGIISGLKENAKWFADLSGFLRSKETEILQEHMRQAISKLFSAQVQSEMKLKQISDVVKMYVRYHLISIANNEAAKMLQSFSERLAKKTGTDDEGNPVWDGYVGELEKGRILVTNIINDLEKQITLTQESMKQAHAMYFILDNNNSNAESSDLVAPLISKQWAEEAFHDLGGTQVLFEMLREEDGRAVLLGKLQNRAMEILSHLRINDEENPVFAVLDAQQNLSQLFSDFMHRAMPWISARVDSYLKDQNPNDQYKCYIGVKNSNHFEKKYGALLRSRLPTSTLITQKELSFVEIDTPGKIVCYTELSGIPLPALKGQNEWYSSYRVENTKTPVHTHRRTSTFVHPRELSLEELASRAEDFRYFIQAITTGVLSRTEKGDESGLYRLRIKGQTRYVGDEKLLRMEGFDGNYRAEIIHQTESDLELLNSPDQIALLIALLDYYVNSVYPEKVLLVDGKDKLIKALPTLVCERLVDEYKMKLRHKIGEESANSKIESAVRVLLQWTEEIKGSKNDAYLYEINEKEFVEKRVLKREVFTLYWRIECVNDISPHHVAIEGSAQGPFDIEKLRELVRIGKLVLNTKVWKPGLDKWITAKESEELSSLFIVPPPLGDVPPPLD